MKYTYTHSLVLVDKKTGLVTKTYLVNSEDEYLDIMDNINSEIWTVKSFGSAHEKKMY